MIRNLLLVSLFTSSMAACTFGADEATGESTNTVSDCTASEETETSCDDGLDNDCDGDIDSADSDCTGECPDVCAAICSGEPEPEVPEGCPVPLCECGGEPGEDCQNNETSCDDGLDNDCDGDIDSADSDCTGECPDVCAAVCSGEPEPEVPEGCPVPLCECGE